MNSNSSTRFLVIDDNAESRYLLGKTLLQMFPHAVLYECQSAQSALEIAVKEPLTAVIIHRTTDQPGVELIRTIRERNVEIPLIMVSGLDRRAEALAAGADKFVPFDEWPRIGTVLQDVLIVRMTMPTGSRSRYSSVEKNRWA